MSDHEILLQTRRFSVVRHQQTLPDGSIHTRESVQHPGAVVILPLVDVGHVCLIRNFRIAVNETLLELPAGTLDHDEEPAATARRELIEETGYRAQDITLLHQFYMSPGILNEKMWLYLATGLTPGETAREAGEDIQNLVVTVDEAITMAADGTIRDAKTLVALLLYDRLRQPH
jgi:ADP-ribose pyrophosphatase